MAEEHPSAFPRPLPPMVSFGEALTDMIREDDERWRAMPGGAAWNVARALRALGLPATFAGAISRDALGDQLFDAGQVTALDPRYIQRVQRSPLLAMVYQRTPPQYFFIGEDSADRSGDRSAAAGGFGRAHNIIGKGDFGGAGLDRRGESRWGIGQGLGIHPVSFAFERIGRQRHALARFGSVEGTPVDLDSGGPEFPERFEGVGVVAARFLDVAAGGKGEVSGFAIE